MRIVLFLSYWAAIIGRARTSPGGFAGAKKRPRVCGLFLAAPGPPGVDEMILNFDHYAKSLAERFR
jgi:hypothetical protein